MLLSLTVLLPVVGLLIIWAAPAKLAKVVNVVTCFAVFFLTCIIWVQMNGMDTLQLEANEAWIPSVGIRWHLAVDGLSLSLLLLTAFVSVTASIASWNIQKSPKGYHMMFLLLLTGMLGVFVAMDLFLFYVFWEIMLLPMYFLIGIWGGPRRQYASLKFFLYTLAGSVLLLAGLIIVRMNAGTWSIPEITRLVSEGMAKGEPFSLTGSVSPLLVFIGMFIGFAVKVPTFPFHTWLPDAHVEAPTPISMILAGVLLKMGGYGLMRIAYPFFPEAASQMATVISVISVIAIVYGAFVALAQTDFKKMIAYSSVSHMGFVTLGLAAGTAEAMNGAMYMMLAHGTISAMLFMIVGVIYERAHHRDIDRFGGLAWSMPKYGVFASFAFFASLGLPGLSGFIAEMTTLIGAFKSESQRWAAWVALAGIVLTAAYYLITLQKVYLGKTPKVYEDKEHYPDLSKREWAVLLPLAAVTLLMGVWPAWAMDLYSYFTDGLHGLLTLATGGAQ